MIHRHNEVDGYHGPEAPVANAYLRNLHPDSYLGYPTYRVVHTQHVLCFSAGEWADWESDIPPDERGKLVAGTEGVPVPDSVARRHVTEMREVRYYVEFEESPGWVLERWMPPDFWGVPETWELRTLPGTSLPVLGPFPARGRYMHIGGPYSQMPTGPFLERLVEYWQAMRDEVLSYKLGTYIRHKEHLAIEADARREDKWNRDASAANLTALSPFLSMTLEAGVARQQAVEHAGITGHYGN